MAHDLTFIGPRPEVLERFASKYAVRRMLGANGLPTVPGSRGIVTDLRDALDGGAEAGYPVLLKPSAGGGGRGTRLVRSPREMEQALPLARSEAQAAFGDDRSTSRSGSRSRATSRSRSWSTSTVTVCTWESATAASSGGTRRSSGGSVAGHGRRRPGAPARPRHPQRGRGGLRGRRHPVIPARRRGQLLLHRDQLSDPGRAPRDAAPDRGRSRCRADPDCGGERLSLQQDQFRFRGHAIEFRINAEDPSDNFRPRPARSRASICPAVGRSRRHAPVPG